MQNDNFPREPIQPPQESVVSEVLPAMPLRILQGAVGGLIGALLGGVVWGLIFQFTDYEVGYAAWGIGLLCGWAVGYFSFNGRGIIFQLIAIACSVAGILIGKYYILYVIQKEVALEDYGSAYAAEVNPLSIDFLFSFFDSVTFLVDLYDVIFVGLAVYTAWRMLKKMDEVQAVAQEGI